MPPLSPAPSEISGSSRRSTSSQSFRIVSDSHRTASIRSSEARSISASLAEKTITATAELLKSGALPGDTIPVRIMINHNRQIRSPHGIIITLYRQGRLDVHPAIPLGPSDADGKKVYEDFIPKSRTGLSGLSLGTSRSNSVFRKDLFQTFAPLIIDPTTMTATVKTSIRIPEDAFPTITRVPGAMISFRYYVEVVIDLRGKLTAQDRFLPWLNMVSGNNFSTSGQVITGLGHTNNSTTSTLAGNVLDTDAIRREKGVVAMMFEVVIGTRDSSRRLQQNQDDNVSVIDAANAFRSAVNDSLDTYVDHVDGHSEEQGQNDDAEYYPEDGVYDYEDTSYWPDHPPTGDQYYDPSEGPIRVPDTQEPEDEKTKLRRAEEMLLPSQPPGGEGVGSSRNALAPTAPDIAEDDALYDHHISISNGFDTAALSSAMSVNTIVPSTQESLPSSLNHEQLDDKQELERRRLMMVASAPASDQHNDVQTVLGSIVTPSAPILEEEDQLSHLHAETDETLPTYQR